MRRPRLVVEAFSAAGLVLILGCVNSACASTNSWDEPVWTGGQPARSTLLKLGAVYSTYEYADGTRNYKRPPKVDSNLVQQINQLRQAVPSWRGLPHMMPGATGSIH